MCYMNSRTSPKPFFFLIFLFSLLFGAETAVAKLSQSIAFGPLPQVFVGTTGTLGATASSGLPVAFSSKAPSICTVTGNTVAGVGTGYCKIAASQPGDAAYAAAPASTAIFKIARQSQRIVFDSFPQVTTGGLGTVTATASSGLPVMFTSKTPTVCTVSDTTVTGLAVGICKIVASQSGNNAYSPAPSLTYIFRIVAPVTNLLDNPIYADSKLQGDWNFDLWTGDQAPVTAAPNAPAPGFSGKTIEVLHGPGGEGWGAFGLANRIDWNHVTTLYMNEVKTLEFDIYIEPDATGIENLEFILEDTGNSNQPKLTSFLPGWTTTNPSAVIGRWMHVSINLTKLGAKVPGFSRFLFANNGANIHPHYHLANVLIRWVRDTLPPTIKLQPAQPNLTYDALTLNFSTNKPTLYKIDYGTSKAYGTTITSAANAWSTQHSVTLPGLSRGHTYYYQVTAWGPEPSAKLGVKTGYYKMPAVPTQAPVIADFAGAPSEIPAGKSAKLTWAVTDYDTLTIDQGVGSVAQIPGATGVTVAPTQSLTYTLTATNVKGTTTRSVSITVNDIPAVNAFGATPAKIAPGGTATLNWDISSADTLTIDHGIGDVTAISGAVGVAVSPATTTTYTLTATNAYGESHQTATVIVDTTAGGQPINPVWVMGYYIGYQKGLQPPDKIDYSTMTHIMVGAVLPNPDGSLNTSFYTDNGLAWAQETVNRAHAAGIKAILMLGGQYADQGFEATNNPAIRATFVANVKQLVEDMGFDGVDIDWEPIRAAYRPALLALMQALQAPDALPRSSYIYTIPVGWNNMNPWSNEMVDPYWGTVAAYVDRMSTMSYSMLWFGEGWESWHSSALYGNTPLTPSSIDNTVQALRIAGVPDAKIGIGIGFYGTAYENGYLTPESGFTKFVHQDPPTIPGYVTAPHQSTLTARAPYGDNSMSYSNIMHYVYRGSAYRWDDVAKAPYLSFDQPIPISFPGVTDLRTTFLTYEDEQGIAEKGAYVRNNGLGGAIIWTISQGYLGAWKQTGELDPLMKAVKGAFLE